MSQQRLNCLCTYSFSSSAGGSSERQPSIQFTISARSALGWCIHEYSTNSHLLKNSPSSSADITPASTHSHHRIVSMNVSMCS